MGRDTKRQLTRGEATSEHLPRLAPPYRYSNEPLTSIGAASHKSLALAEREGNFASGTRNIVNIAGLRPASRFAIKASILAGLQYHVIPTAASTAADDMVIRLPRIAV
jgi:hypothetical protein